MKTVAIELIRKQVTSAYVQVPDDWTPMQIRRALVRHPSALFELADDVDPLDWASPMDEFDVDSKIIQVEADDVSPALPVFTFPEAQQ